MTHMKNLNVLVHSLVETNVEWTSVENFFVERARRALRNITGRRVQYTVQRQAAKGGMERDINQEGHALERWTSGRPE